MESVKDITQKFSDVYLLPAVASTFIAIIYFAYKCDGTNLRRKPLTFLKEIFYVKKVIKSDAENLKLLSDHNIFHNVLSAVLPPSAAKVRMGKECVCFKKYPSKIIDEKIRKGTGNALEIKESNQPVIANEKFILFPSETSCKTQRSSNVSDVKIPLCHAEISKLSSEPLELSEKRCEETGNILQFQNLALLTNENSLLFPSGNSYETVKGDFNSSLNSLYEKEPLWDYYDVFYPSEVQTVAPGHMESLKYEHNGDTFYPSDVQAGTAIENFNTKNFDSCKNRDVYIDIYGEPDFKTEKDEDGFIWNGLEEIKWPSKSEKLESTRFTDYLQIVYE